MLHEPRANSREWIVAAAISAVVVLASLAPYLYGAAVAPPGKVFTGVVTISHYDTYTYLAWMEQGREGHWLFRDLYSSEAQPRLPLRPRDVADPPPAGGDAGADAG